MTEQVIEAKAALYDAAAAVISGWVAFADVPAEAVGALTIRVTDGKPSGFEAWIRADALPTITTAEPVFDRQEEGV